MSEWNMNKLHGFLIWCYTTKRFKPQTMRAVERAVNEYLKQMTGGGRELVTKGGPRCD